MQVKDNQVLEVRTKEKHNVDGVVVGGVNHAKPHRLSKSQRSHFASKGVPAKRHVLQFNTRSFPETLLLLPDAAPRGYNLSNP